ncbi:helix-turn-helix transcriptional regulator [Butyricimonas hominis]|uniref:helix-turn-helix domain-containing protein n=1 Tax=Butyricimonas hominis TaxID=2763032 RepID=UPI003514E0A9
MQERLNQIIEQRGLTATKFAALIGVNASTISHILAGRNKPGFDIINNIAKTFPDIDLGWLITGNGSMYTSSSKKENNHFSEEPTLFDLDEPKKQTDTPIQKKEKKTEIEIIGKAIAKSPTKKIKRIVLFFEDGSFEDYEK